MAKDSGARTATRLPATRESRPALIGLAILLIVGGALGSAYMAIQAGHRAYFVQVTQDVSQGGQITDADLGQVSLPSDFTGGIPIDQRNQVVGKSAAARLMAGTILTPRMVSARQGVAPGQGQLTVPVDNSPFVQSLQPGAALALVISSSDVTSGTQRQVIAADLIGVSTPSGGGGAFGGSASSSQAYLTVAVDVSCLSSVTAGIQAKTITPAIVGQATGVVSKTCAG